jgi:hypothetical protein
MNPNLHWTTVLSPPPKDSQCCCNKEGSWNCQQENCARLECDGMRVTSLQDSSTHWLTVDE